MSSPSYYLLAALPPLDTLGGEPPLTLVDLVREVGVGRPGRLVRVVALEDDLCQREAVMSGELAEPAPAVLTSAQVRGEAPLPDALEDRPIEGQGSGVPADALWRAYFVHARSVAERIGSPFLGGWTTYRVSVRDALVSARAKTLGFDPSHYRVARALVEPGADVDAALDLWSVAPDPLHGERALLGAAWRWIDHAEPRFTFRDDEFAAYAARLVLLHRWHRMEGRGVEGEAA